MATLCQKCDGATCHVRKVSPAGVGSFGGLRQLAPPLARTRAESPFKERVEQAQAAVAAIQSDLDYLFIGGPEEVTGLEEAKFRLAGAGGLAEMFAKEPVEVARAATAEAGQLFGRMVNEFNVGHFGDDLMEPALGGDVPGRGRWKPGHRLGKETGGELKNLGPFEQIIFGRMLGD